LSGIRTCSGKSIKRRNPETIKELAHADHCLI
jgi:hypothetical protein